MSVRLAFHLLVGGPWDGRVVDMYQSFMVPVPAPSWPGRVVAGGYAVEYRSMRFGSGTNSYRIGLPVQDPGASSIVLVSMSLLALSPGELERVRFRS